MSFNDFYKRFTAFGIAFALSLFAAAFFNEISFFGIFKKEFDPAAKTVASKVNRIGNNVGGNRIGSSDGGSAISHPGYGKTNTLPEKPVGPTEGVRIISKPQAPYTDAALANAVQGKVVLRVTFSANGTIGAISVINGLPDGLTETAKEAAKQIKFKPATRGGVPYSVTKPVEYTFTI